MNKKSSGMAGLYNKYLVLKNSGEPIDSDAEYFVLRIDTDAAARRAVLHYALMIEPHAPEFASELRAWIAQHDPELPGEPQYVSA